MLKQVTAVALCVSSFVVASDSTKIAAKHLLASSQHYNVTYDANDVIKVNGQRVEHYDLDSSLRKPNALKDLFKSDRSKLEVSRIGAGYALKRHDQLKGGGLGGTTLGAYIGKFTVLFIGHGAILIASSLTGPAAPATFAALEGTFGLQIEAASQVGAIAGGIIGGVATGPV
ncbi:hypothetical protein JST99_05415 [Candidatus Dependentiae bacterium]|nr:hypothetical protein [Candidatus Dependentiae bacterium]MCC7414569.1 hypothetical protein [Campylobacterota bacterium]